MPDDGIRAKLAALLAELEDEPDQSPDYIVCDATELLRGSLTKRKLDFNTRRVYAIWLDHCDRVVGRVPLRELTRAHGRQLLTALADRPPTASQSCKVFTQAVDAAVDAGWMPYNPLLGMRKPGGRRRKRTLTDETCSQLEADMLSHEPFAIYAAVRWQIDTGWRCGEVLGLNRDDVDLERRVVHLRETKTGPRHTQISSAVSEWAATWMHAAGPVFRDTGRRVTYRRVMLALGRSSERVGIRPKVTTHVFRHSFISRARRLGVRREVIAELVGHDDLRSTDRYTHVNEHDVADAAELVCRPSEGTTR